ncbi:MAG: hexitol phosphatase HxpB [Myxococcales bacterium]|nr:hexitol phosphatase HxpB [Myxococcales bacterium]
MTADRAHLFSAVVFDMDGLLIDSEPLWVRAEVEVFASVGIELEPADCARTKGLRTDDVIAYWDEARGLVGASREEAHARLVARVVELVEREGRALPGVHEAISLARSIAPRVGLASSSPPPIIAAAMRRLGLTDAFDVAISASEDAYGKPHPAVYLRAAAQLGAAPTACLAIEDSLAGVIAAKAARMKCVAVPEEHPAVPPAFSVADAIVGELREVTLELARAVRG